MSCLSIIFTGNFKFSKLDFFMELFKSTFQVEVTKLSDVNLRGKVYYPFFTLSQSGLVMRTSLS